MTFIYIKSVEGEVWWLNPSLIYGINKNSEGNIDIYFQDDIVETSEFKTVGDLMDYIGISYNAEQQEDDGFSEEEENENDTNN